MEPPPQTRCRVCRMRGGECMIKCDKCEDWIHFICAILETRPDQELADIDWWKSRPPTELDIMNLKVYELYAEDCERLKDPENVFICSICHHTDLMKEAHTCVVCGDAYDVDNFLECSEPRCDKGIHRGCYLTSGIRPPLNHHPVLYLNDEWDAPGRRRDLKNFLGDSAISSFQCFGCQLRTRFRRARFDPQEVLIPSLALFEWRHEEVSLLPCKSFSWAQRIMVLFEARNPEPHRIRTNEWAACKWAGYDIHNLEFMAEADEELSEDEDASVEDEALSQDLGESLDQASVSCDTAQSIDLGEEVSSPELRPRGPAPDPDLMDTYEAIARDGWAVIPSTGTSSSTAESLSPCLPELDDLVNWPLLLCVVFPAVAQVYDLIEMSAKVREPEQALFSERILPTSQFIKGDERSQAPKTIASLSEAYRLPQLSNLDDRYRLCAPLPRLLELYDQLEALLGRAFFRLLYRSDIAALSVLLQVTSVEKDLFKSSRYSSMTTQVREQHHVRTLTVGVREIHKLPFINYAEWKAAHPEPPLQAWMKSWTAITNAVTDEQFCLKDEPWRVAFAQELRRARASVRETAFVLHANNRMFCDDLVYHPLLNPTVNCTSDQHPRSCWLSLQKVFERFGIVPPIRYSTSPMMGYHIRATAPIDNRSIIGEYAGVVESRRWNTNKFLAVSDSIYDLSEGDRPANRSLCVVPEPYTSIVRYINGINNAIPSEADNVNVASLMAPALETDENHIIVRATKPIGVGEQLLLDYNEGGDQGYPTNGFLDSAHFRLGPNLFAS